MKTVALFISRNRIALLGMLAGLVLAYFYWLDYGVFWGTYPFSSECWLNCAYGTLAGGFIGSLLAWGKTLP